MAADKQDVSLSLEIHNADGTPFATQTTTYYGVARDAVHLIEDEILKMQGNLLTVAKDMAEKKKQETVPAV